MLEDAAPSPPQLESIGRIREQERTKGRNRLQRFIDTPDQGYPGKNSGCELALQQWTQAYFLLKSLLSDKFLEVRKLAAAHPHICWILRRCVTVITERDLSQEQDRNAQLVWCLPQEQDNGQHRPLRLLRG